MNKTDLTEKSNFLQLASERVYYWSDKIWRWHDSIASKRGLAIIFIFLFSFAGSSIVGILSGIPQPYIHDEFSYLLAADTFASGRLTNPTHPMWVHFESFHIINQPTYMSIYLPAQGLILAAGQIAGGHPIWGVWISVALMCAAISWMLYGWIPPKWAFLGSLLTVLYFGIFGYWSQSYWGGAVPATGGALVFGALRRIVDRQHIRDVLLMGMGLVVLATSRPWEGMIASIPAGLMLFSWIFSKNSLPIRKSFIKVILPILCILIITAIGMGSYNKSVTGNALQLPYTLYLEKYFSEGAFVWEESLPEPDYRHEVFQKFNRDYSKSMTEKRSSLKGVIRSFIHVTQRSKAFFFNGPLIIPIMTLIIVLPYVLKNKWMRLALLTGVFFITVSNPLSTAIAMPHYLAPITCLAILFIAQGLRCMSFLRLHRKPIGKIIVLIFLLISIKHMAEFPLGKIVRLEILKQEREYSWALKRAEIIKELKGAGGRHLIIVRYYPDHSPHQEWVYNEADIDNATVVWAREMDMNQNLKLLEYFKDRNVWLLEINDDNSPPQLITYQFKNN